MPPQSGLAQVIMFSTYRWLIRLESCEHDILKTNEPILMQFGTNNLLARA